MGDIFFVEFLPVVQLFQKDKISKLLDNVERIGNSAGPEVVPDAVYFGFKFSGDHK